jgi:hypothetical protein
MSAEDKPMGNSVAILATVALEIGDRTPGDEASYPDDDLKAMFVDGTYRMTRKDGTAY